MIYINLYKKQLTNITHKYNYYQLVYTDAYKIQDRTVYEIIINDRTIQVATMPHFTTESLQQNLKQ